MSRHRIVRTMDYNDEYDGYDDVYGHSVDDDSCISPSDASQWLYDRAKGQQSMSAFVANNADIEEEDEENYENGERDHEKKRRDSENFQMPVLDDLTQAKLMSCMDEIRSVVGDAISDRRIVEAVTKFDYDVARALDSILNGPSDSAQEKQQVQRPAKEQSEKDSKTNLALSNIKFKLPTLKPGPTLSNSANKNIDELIRQKFENINSTGIPAKPIFAVPQLKASPKNSESGSPKLGQLIHGNLKAASSTQLTSGGTFTIPKLGSSLPDQSGSPQTLGSPSNHDLLLRKIMESKKVKTNEMNDLNVNFQKNLTLSNRSVTAPLIDLTEALSTSAIQSTKQTPVREVEQFHIPFIDCDRSGPVKRPEVNYYCQMDMSGILKEKPSNIQAKPTNFGKVLILKYRCRTIPFVSHTFSTKHQVVRFKFDSRSPDDIIQSHLNKNRICFDFGGKES